MSERTNELGQPIGFAVPTWTERRRPPRSPMEGRLAVLEPIDPRRHALDLHTAFAEDKEGRLWTYLAVGPFQSAAAYSGWLTLNCMGEDPLFFAILDRATGKAVGVASFLRIDPRAGSIEVGHICLSPAAQRRPIATEAMFLMMRRVFDELAYRRYEWKCDALNAPSRQAALRLGFTFEGIFRQALVYKGRNRDTAWYAMIDREWPALKAAYERWLDPANFATDGQQRESLSRLTAEALAATRAAAAG